MAEMSPKARIVVGFCGLMAGLSYCDRVNMSVAVVTMQQEFKWKDSDKGTVLGSFFWGYLVSQTWGATLAHRFGGKNVLGVAAILWSLLTVVVPSLASKSIQPLVCGRVLLGIAEGVTFPAAYYLLRQYVNQDSRSRAIAVLSIGTLCGAIFSFISSPLLIEYYGWPMVFYFFGGLVGPVFVLLWFAVLPSKPTGADLLGSGSSKDEDEGDVPQSASQPTDYMVMAQDPLILSICTCHFTHNLCHYSLAAFFPSFLHDKLDITGGSLAISSLPWFFQGASVFVSSLISDGLISKGYERSFVRRLFTVGAFSVAGMSMIGVGALSTLDANLPKLSILILLSFALAGNGSSTAAGFEAVKLDLAKSPNAASRLQSLSNSIATLAGILGVPLVPLLKGDDGNDWSTFFYSLGSCFLIAGLVFHRFGRYNSAFL